MTTYRLRAVSELSEILDKWGISPSMLSSDPDLHPREIHAIVLSRLQPRLKHYNKRKDHAIQRVMNDLRGDLAFLSLDLVFRIPPLTPRRTISPPKIVDDPFRPKFPKPLPLLHDWTVVRSVHAQMTFLVRTLFWLKGLLSLMDQSIAKSHDDLVILDSGPLHVGQGDHQRPYWRVREIVPTDEAMDLSVCNLDRRFFGPGYIPRVAGLPSNEDVATIRAFKASHHRVKVKHMDRLFFLHDLISDELIPQVDAKLGALLDRELRWLRKNGQVPDCPFYTDYEGLGDVDSASALQNLAVRLQSREWVTLRDALFDVRRLAKYHTGTLQEFLGTLIPLIIAKVVKGTSPAVVKSAIMACGDLLVVYPADAINRFINPMMDALVQKAVGLHQFVSREATLILTSMARRLHIHDVVMLSKVVPLLHDRSHFVRLKAYQLLALFCPSVVSDRNDFLVEYAILMKAHRLQRHIQIKEAEEEKEENRGCLN